MAEQTNKIRIIEDLSYYGKQETYWKLDLALPEDPGAPSPLIIFIHGGAWETCHKRENFESHMIRLMAQTGFAAASIEYRLTGQASFPAQVIDVKRGVSFLRAKSEEFNLDPRRFGVVGHSAGAHLAAMAGTIKDDEWVDLNNPWNASTEVQRVAGLSGIYDLKPTIAAETDHGMSFAKKLIPGPVSFINAQLAAASPVNYIKPGLPPFLLVHGEADELVPPGQSQTFYEKLNAAGDAGENKLVILPGIGHGTVDFEGIREIIIDFFSIWKPETKK